MKLLLSLLLRLWYSIHLNSLKMTLLRLDSEDYYRTLSYHPPPRLQVINIFLFLSDIVVEVDDLVLYLDSCHDSGVVHVGRQPTGFG
jgi:hypothetical protein